VTALETKSGMSVLRKRLVIAACVLLALVVLALLPPLINVNRFQRRIATSISRSVGRPVHLDRVSMTLLPLPGFTLENFVVNEDPQFGSEPVMRADEVKATLRVSSLWRGKLEFSTISLTAPSVNLVRNAAGRWNLETILLQASQIDAAPTQQKRAGSTPRFPYIEATDARVNVKLGDEKTPFSLTGAEFALWLPDPQEWRLRLKAKPARTDTDASDTGELRVEAHLRRAAKMNDVPIQAEAAWRRTPLGEASKVLLGYDAGWRGDAAAEVKVDGTLGDASVTATLHLTDVRRSDFVPSRLMEIDAHCEARATGVLRELRGLRCSIPVDAAAQTGTEAGGQIEGVNAGTLALTGDLPSLLDWKSADLQASLAGVAPGYALDWLRLFSQRIPQSLSTTGEMHGTFSYGPGTAGLWAGSATCDCALSLPINGRSTSTSKATTERLPIHADATIGSDGTGGRSLQIVASTSRTLHPDKTIADLPGGDAEASINGEGLRVRYAATTSAAFLDALKNRLPPLMDSLPEGTGDWTSYRPWGGVQTWSKPVATPMRKRDRRS
jgi:hypothetical protein